MEYLSRIDRLRAFLAEAGCDLFLLNHPPQLRYYTGYSGDSAWLLVGENRCLFFTDGRYTTQAASEIPATIELCRISAFTDFTRRLQDEFGGRTIGIDEKNLKASTWLELRKNLGSEPVAAAAFCSRPRQWKDAEEIELLGRAAKIAESALAATLPLLKPGIKESDIAAEIEYRIRKAGGEGVAFPLIVASGPRSALPHGIASGRIIAPGDPVTIDFGAIFEGYHSDQTCTFFLGEPGAEEIRVYEALYRAQQEGMRALKRKPPRTRELDRLVREVLVEAGLSDYFSHGTGHGIGLEIHEAPSISSGGPDEPLDAGMVFTIEPGCYFPNRWGIRIEDTVRLKKDGYERITTIDKRLERMVLA